MLLILSVVTVVFAILWFFILHSVGENTQRFLCRHQWMFLVVHLPVMYILGTFLGEGMIVGVGSLAGGLLGQIYLAVHGMRKYGLTFLGKRTALYDEQFPDKVRRTVNGSKLKRADLAISKKVLAYTEWHAARVPIK